MAPSPLKGDRCNHRQLFAVLAPHRSIDERFYFARRPFPPKHLTFESVSHFLFSVVVSIYRVYSKRRSDHDQPKQSVKRFPAINRPKSTQHSRRFRLHAPSDPASLRAANSEPARAGQPVHPSSTRPGKQPNPVQHSSTVRRALPQLLHLQPNQFHVLYEVWISARGASSAAAATAACSRYHALPAVRRQQPIWCDVLHEVRLRVIGRLTLRVSIPVDRVSRGIRFHPRQPHPGFEPYIRH